MDIKARKLALIEWILQIGNPEILQKVEAISQSDEEWWGDIAEEERSAILEAKEEARLGKSVSHDEVMERYKKWL